MEKQHKTWLCLAGMVIALMILPALAAVAQMEGTPNLASAKAYEGGSYVWGDLRSWDGSGNESFALGIKGPMGNRSDVGISFYNATITGQDPVNNAVRTSNMQLLSLDMKWQLTSTGSWTISWMPSAAVATRRPTGFNTGTGAFAEQDEMIFAGGLLMERKFGSWNCIINPKAAWWDSSMLASNGAMVRGFGRVVGVGVGLSKPVSRRFSFAADVTPIIDGDNAIDEVTNLLEDRLVWSAALSYHFGGSNPNVLTVYGTNAFGPTAATSLLASPESSVAFGVRFDHEM